MRKYQAIVFGIFLSVLSLQAIAQQQWEEAGEIENAEVIIEKDREIELPYQPRNFDKVPPVNISTSGIKQEYAFPSLSLAVPSTTADIKALKLQEEPLDKYYGNLARLGFGNYMSPLAELYLYTKRNENYLAGVQARHLSFGRGPVDGRNSASSATEIKAEGSFFSDKITGGGDASFGRLGWNYYGYDPTLGVAEGEDSLRHVFNKYGASFHVSNAPSEAGIKAQVRADFKGQNDNFDVSESWLALDSRLEKELENGIFAHLGVFADFIGYNDVTSVGRQRVGVEPTVSYKKDEYTIDAGIRYVYQSDTAVSPSQVYPLVTGTYTFSPALKVVGELSGNSRLNTWQSSTAANPYMGKGLDIHNTNEFLHVGLGASGGTSFMSYQIGFHRRVLKEFGLFVNSESDPSKFILVYDTANFKISEFYGQADFYAGSSLTVTAGFRAFGYDSDTFMDVWHLPGYQLMLSGSYLAFNKVRTKAGLTYMGGIKGWDTQLRQTKELAPGADIFLDVDYLLSERATIFVRFNNIVNQNYEMLSNYPVRGLVVRAGFSYSF